MLLQNDLSQIKENYHLSVDAIYQCLIKTSLATDLSLPMVEPAADTSGCPDNISQQWATTQPLQHGGQGATGAVTVYILESRVYFINVDLNNVETLHDSRYSIRTKSVYHSNMTFWC